MGLQADSASNSVWLTNKNPWVEPDGDAFNGNGWGQSRRLCSACPGKAIRWQPASEEQNRGLRSRALYLVEEEGDARHPTAESPAATAGGGEAGHVEAPGELDDVVPRRGRRRHDQHPAHAQEQHATRFSVRATVLVQETRTDSDTN
jgi:hypothetical protein